MMDHVVYQSLFENILSFQLFIFKDFLLNSLHLVNSTSLGLRLRKQDVNMITTFLLSDILQTE